MFIKNAMVIKTVNDLQLQNARNLRDMLRGLNQDVVLVPFGATELYITIHENELAVIIGRSMNEIESLDLDIATGFQLVSECWEYAEVIMHELSLPFDCIHADVWDEEVM